MNEIFPCIDCGSIDKGQYSIGSREREKVVCRDCSTRRYWELIEQERDKLVICNHHVYSIGSPYEGGKWDYRGFYGDTFVFRRFNGELVVSSNMWNGSEIPVEWQERIPNNAERVDWREWTSDGLNLEFVHPYRYDPQKTQGFDYRLYTSKDTPYAYLFTKGLKEGDKERIKSVFENLEVARLWFRLERRVYSFDDNGLIS